MPCATASHLHQTLRLLVRQRGKELCGTHADIASEGDRTFYVRELPCAVLPPSNVNGGESSSDRYAESCLALDCSYSNKAHLHDSHTPCVYTSIHVVRSTDMFPISTISSFSHMLCTTCSCLH